tara:strand:+ start:545 stop:1228 length:684 start_codon:yes stop_codon:yes gene_type:complete
MQSFMYQGNKYITMPIRSQIFFWDAGKTSDTAGVRSTPVNSADEGKEVDILSGDKGNKNTSSQTQAPNTFVVIERVAMTPSYFTCGERTAADPNPTYRGQPVQYGIAGPNAYFQPRVNDTFYFSNPDGTVGLGMPGTAIPFPSMPSSQSVLDKTLFNEANESGGYGAGDLAPLNIHVMAGQTWDVGVTFTNGGAYQLATVSNSANSSLDVNTDQPLGSLGFSIRSTL